jgi:uncharacterized protein YcbX
MITVGQLWRYPVKSMQGERVDEVSFAPGGAVGDRAYGFVDVATGRLVSAKHPHRYAAMLNCYASFVKAPEAGEPAPPVRVRFPDGETIEGDNEAITRRVSDLLGREVRMVNGASPGLAYEEIWPEMEGFGPDEFYGLLHEEPSHDDTSGERILRIPAGSAARGTLLDFASLHILAGPSLAALAALHPTGEWDSRRFRPNIVFEVETRSGETPPPSGIEAEWIGRELVVGSGARLAVIAHTPRCVMTTLAQPGLARDPKILQTMARSNRQPLGPLGLFAAAGAYAEVVAPGVIRNGDTVELAGENLATSSDLAVVLSQIERLMADARTGQ